MTRLRRIDRLLLAESADEAHPIDSDDQELLISQLLAENNGSHAFYTRILVLTVLAEIPAGTLFLRAFVGREARHVVHFVLLSILCLIGLLYDVSALGTLLGLVGGVPEQVIRRAISFPLLCVVNGLLLVQFYLAIYRQHGFQAKFMILVLPAINYVVMILVRSWHFQTAESIRGLYALRYKFKNV